MMFLSRLLSLMQLSGFGPRRTASITGSETWKMPYSKLHSESRSPFEIALIAFSIGFSVIQVSTDTYPNAIDAFTSSVYQTSWGIIYMISSLAAAYGVVSKNHYRGLNFECWGIYVMGGALLVYGTSIIATNKPGAFFAAGFFVTFALACYWRGRTIHRGLKRINRGELSKDDIYVIKRDPESLDDK